MRPTSVLQIKVGLLILVSLVILSATILALGKQRRLFERKVHFEIHFSRIVGLREGAHVSLGGVTVGSVERLSFPQDISQNYIVVRIRVAGEVAPRIRQGMVARIRTQGILGDKYVELTGGSAASDPLPEGGLITAVDPVDYEAILGEGGDVVQNFVQATNSLKTIFRSIEEGKGLLGQLVTAEQEAKWAETADNLRIATGSLRKILLSIEKGEGFLGQLVHNREAGEAMMEDLRGGLSRLRSTTESLHRTAEKLEKGEGTLGTLIQDPHTGKELLASLRRSAANLESITRQFRDGGGVLQRLMTDRPYADRLLSRLDETTRDLASITSKIEKGEGTIGALVNDPTLYRDAKELVGNAKGSWLYSIYRFFRNLISAPEVETEGGSRKEDQGGQ